MMFPIDLPLAAPIADFFTPQQIGVYVGQVVTVLIALIALISTRVGKRTRTPQDDQARAEFGYKILKERYDEVVTEKNLLSEVVDKLREDSRNDFSREQASEDLVRKLNRQITTYSKRLELYETRMAIMADKVRRGIPITLEDIYGNIEGLPGSPEDELNDIEFTIGKDELSREV